MIEWVEVVDMNIKSDRHALVAERISAFVIDSLSGALLEVVHFTPKDKGEAEHFTWPRRLAERINAQAFCIRAGERTAEGFAPVNSQYRNKLWKPAGESMEVFSSNCHLNSWIDAGNLRAGGGLPAGMSITLRIVSAKHGVCYELLNFVPAPGRAGRYDWPKDLAQYINHNSMLMRAGEKNDTLRLIEPVHSAYRNRMWFPAGSDLTFAARFEPTAQALESARRSYLAALAVAAASPPSQQALDAWLAALEQGRFEDIHYPPTHEKVKNVAGLYTHLGRIKGFANHLHQTEYDENNPYYVAALSALGFYIECSYETENWWEKVIGLAKVVAESIILLVERYHSACLKQGVSYLKAITHIDSAMRGANLADFAYVQVCWSLCGWKNTADPAFLIDLYGASETVSSLCVTVPRQGAALGEGINVDFSFSQHNQCEGRATLIQAGSYGNVFMDSVFKVEAVLAGAFKLNAKALKVLECFLVYGMGWFSYGPFYELQVCGRSISRRMPSAAQLSGWAQRLLIQAPDHPEALREIIRKTAGDESHNQFFQGTRAYWVNDYLVGRAGQLGIWAKVMSTRSLGTEIINGENLKGFYLGAGTCLFTQGANEYHDIQPVWDWQRLPGITAEQVPNFAYPGFRWGKEGWGTHDFAGVMSDGVFGVASMNFSRLNVKNARKSVLMVGEEVVFMGSHIDISDAVHTVQTSVNQAWLAGEVLVKYRDGGAQSLSLGEQVISSEIAEIIHAGFRYDFAQSAQTVGVRAALQSGSWRELNESQPDERKEGEVFSVWVEHGKASPGNYAYRLSCTDCPAQAHEREFLCNESIHLVRSGDGSFAIGTAFVASASTLTLAHLEMKFLAPVAFIASNPNEHELQLTIADLSQTLDAIGIWLDWGGIGYSLSLPVPDSEDLRGKHISYVLERCAGSGSVSVVSCK